MEHIIFDDNSLLQSAIAILSKKNAASEIDALEGVNKGDTIIFLNVTSDSQIEKALEKVNTVKVFCESHIVKFANFAEDPNVAVFGAQELYDHLPMESHAIYVIDNLLTSEIPNYKSIIADLTVEDSKYFKRGLLFEARDYCETLHRLAGGIKGLSKAMEFAGIGKTTQKFQDELFKAALENAVYQQNALFIPIGPAPELISDIINKYNLKGHDFIVLFSLEKIVTGESCVMGWRIVAISTCDKSAIKFLIESLGSDLPNTPVGTDRAATIWTITEIAKKMLQFLE